MKLVELEPPGGPWRALDRLKVRGIVALKAPGDHADGSGLYLRISTAGARFWAFMTVVTGKWVEIGIGPAVSVRLAPARRFTCDNARRHRIISGSSPDRSVDAISIRS